MKLFSVIFYLLSIGSIYLGILIAAPNFNYSLLFNTYGIFSVITGIILTTINFSIKEILSLKSLIFSNKSDYLVLKNQELIIKTIWKNIFNSGIFFLIMVSILFFSNADKYIFSDYLFNISGIIFYTFFTRIFVFKPLELSITKKLIYLKKYVNPKQTNKILIKKSN